MNRLSSHQSFLSISHTMALCNRDFVEWHGGVEEYGFWAIGVEDPVWIHTFESARVHLSQFLYPGYQRAPHITVAPSGLFDSEHFSEVHLKSQISTLVKAKIESFPVKTGSLNSFASAPYISIVDPTDSLDTIRELLQKTRKEDNLGQYLPHVTLGHYREAFETAMVLGYLQNFWIFPIEPLVVKELLFCAYKTKESQGPFEVLERVKLSTCVHSHDSNF